MSPAGSRGGPGTGLAALLRERTRDVHADAESSPYAVALVAGEVDAVGYAALLASLRPVYAALESGPLRGDPRVAPVLLPGLERLAVLEHDLDLLVPHTARSEPGPQARAYARRVVGVADVPAAFVAHHWTRCLGDLAGGQVLRRSLLRSLGPAARRLRFHDFDHLGPPPRVRARYRLLLDSVPWDDAEREQMVAEARHAFRLNRLLLDELARTYLTRT